VNNKRKKYCDYLYRGKGEHTKEILRLPLKGYRRTIQERNIAITYTGVTANNTRKKYGDYLYRGNDERTKEIL